MPATTPSLDPESLIDRFHEDADNGGAVYKVPNLVDRFLSFSWIAVLPSGQVALSRWTPNPEEDISLARERDETIPRHTGLHMWKRVSAAEAADRIADGGTSLERLGTIEIIDEKPHLDLDDPEAETHRPEAFR